MPITNTAKPSAPSFTNSGRVVNYETFDTLTTTFNTETRTFDQMGTTWTNTPKQSTTITNTPKPQEYTDSNTVFQTTALRNNYTGTIGFRFTVSSPITVYRVGRLYVAQNTQDHVANIWVSTNTSTPIATATILAATTSDTNGYKYADLPSPVTLSPGNTYNLVTDFVSGGDMFKDSWSTTGTMQSIFTVTHAVYNNVVSTYPINTVPGALSYDSLSMKYI